MTGRHADDVAKLARRRVLVVGDLVLDEYLTGRPSRISREAPVLILEETARDYRAGSAGSPAASVVALGSRATVVGVVGMDMAGDRLLAHLEELGITPEGLLRQADLSTATKTRILAEGFTGGLRGRQQVLRVDRVAPLPREAAEECARRVARLAPEHDAVLLSDYRGGVVTAGVIEAAKAAGKPVCVDSQGDLSRFAGVDLVKINEAEAQAALGSGDLLARGDGLRRELRLGSLVVTLGPRGMALFSEEGSTLVPVVRQTDVFDVTGAGDAVIAVLTLGLLAGLPLQRSAELANAAASVVVRRLGVATVSPAELVEALEKT